jgi:hypothetical protein
MFATLKKVRKFRLGPFIACKHCTIVVVQAIIKVSGSVNSIIPINTNRMLIGIAPPLPLLTPTRNPAANNATSKKQVNRIRSVDSHRIKLAPATADPIKPIIST